MLVKRREVRVGEHTVRTPLLLPSFSSKGFPKVQKILDTMSEYISDELLVSAYDIHHGSINTDLDFSSMIFVDSGGYEASKDHELSEIYEGDYKPKPWTLDQYQAVIENWSFNSPTVFVSFDHPDLRLSIADQISRGVAMRIPATNAARSILFKPTTANSKRLPINEIVENLSKTNDFSIIGVTEKELGKSIIDRMNNIARIRNSLDGIGFDTPIHVFGSLDTLSTYLYFLSGADIFDGLTWLRYAFFEGDTIYKHSYGVLDLPITTNSDIVEGRCWTNNYQYMQEMRLNMSKFAKDGDYIHFGKHRKMIQSAHESMVAEL